MSELVKKYILGEGDLRKFCEGLPGEGIIFLRGKLGAGKTSLVREWARALGYFGEISSPTFSLMQEYEAGDKKIYHYDFYQYKNEELLRRGLFETFFEPGLHLIEWGDEDLRKLLEKYKLKISILEIKILPDLKDQKREYLCQF